MLEEVNHWVPFQKFAYTQPPKRKPNPKPQPKTKTMKKATTLIRADGCQK